MSALMSISGMILTTLMVIFSTSGISEIPRTENLAENLTAEKISIPFPESVKAWPEKVLAAAVDSSDPCNFAGYNTGNTGTTKVQIVDCRKIVYYQIVTWGSVEADIEDFRAKVAETLNDARGWAQIATFKEVNSGADVQIILSDAWHLGATAGCSAELSCTTWSNQVIINDLRWREGTEASRAAGMSTRDYQHMVINHEMGHWLGHYAHVEYCPNGGPAPVMLQQSTGLRGCDSFNAWPLASELWTLR